ncbi:MAG: aconitate hydratase AcnA [Planctomycetaceae bacterium]|jgi:aconitate hydratase|nr:aconitate hydratase AcnA [Planctomycetaceae bacterium]
MITEILKPLRKTLLQTTLTPTTELAVSGKSYRYVPLAAAGIDLAPVPYSLRILLESVLRSQDGFQITEKDVQNLARFASGKIKTAVEVPFKPARVILQDFTGVPAVVDLAAMRAAMARLGGKPEKVNPLIPVDLVVDHSIQTDFAGCPAALEKNTALEFDRNAERYTLLRWAQQSLNNFRVVPPSAGIIHQVNLEYLADVVHHRTQDNLLCPDSVLGTDSHTVMINGLGVLGWGVGGIEAEAVMLGQPYYMLAPQVVGVELTGKLPSGITATDLVLTLTEMLRKEGVVGKFVEFFGAGARNMPAADRAVLSNMAPEYGATTGYFPVDEQTILFLQQTGREPEQIAVAEQYCKVQKLFASPDQPVPEFSKTLTLDLASVEPCLAGPKRPQDRIPLSRFKNITSPPPERTLPETSPKTAPKIAPETVLSSENFPQQRRLPPDKTPVVIAAVTSCTNTSNPALMLAAGLLAKKAVEKGLRVPPWVKTSLAPGSRAVAAYLENAGLLKPLETLGFHVAGYGCMTCIGNSGPLAAEIEKQITENNLTAAAVLSGNRNFEGRVHPLVKANYLASPPLVVAFALAGVMETDMPAFLADNALFPAEDEIAEAVKKSGALSPAVYRNCYRNIFGFSETWNCIAAEPSELFAWNPQSTYIQEPPFLAAAQERRQEGTAVRGRVLALLGDSVTTDHISPAGSIKPDSPAGKFLTAAGTAKADFNSYGSRRGNDKIMTRGTFANIRIRNRLVPETEGGFTKFLPTGEVMPIYDAAVKYKEAGIPLVILAGAEYGTGSSRDWAAKGTALLGVKAVMARSFERIHRGNLVGMGVLPLEFAHGSSVESLQLTGEEEFTLPLIGADFLPGSEVSVFAEKPVTVNGREMFSTTEFRVTVRIDTPVELQYYLNGGILPAVLKLLK